MDCIVQVAIENDTVPKKLLAKLRTELGMGTSYAMVKSAVHGADPNWGRIVAVAGRSGVDLSEERFFVEICGTRVFERAEPTEFDPLQVAGAMRADTVTIRVDMGVGDAEATGWGCDLSAEYVSINADYHT